MMTDESVYISNEYHELPLGVTPEFNSWNKECYADDLVRIMIERNTIKHSEIVECAKIAAWEGAKEQYSPEEDKEPDHITDLRRINSELNAMLLDQERKIEDLQIKHAAEIARLNKKIAKLKQ